MPLILAVLAIAIIIVPRIVGWALLACLLLGAWRAATGRKN